jgi:hypothetical protein
LLKPGGSADTEALTVTVTEADGLRETDTEVERDGDTL